MREFVIEMDFIGVPKKNIDILLQTYGLKQVISAKGRWLPFENGTLIGPNGNDCVAGKFVTPLITKIELYDLKWIMERMFGAGVIVAQDRPIKIHFRKGYSERYASKILKMLVVENKLLLTLFLYPKYSSLLPVDSRFLKLSDEGALFQYKNLINNANDRAEISVAEDLIYNTLIKGAKPDYYNDP